MSAVTPVTGNKCKGTYADSTPNVQLYCYKGDDENGDPIYTCATWRLFRSNCPKINRQCSSLSSAYVPAVTVCGQRLW